MDGSGTSSPVSGSGSRDIRKIREPTGKKGVGGRDVEHLSSALSLHSIFISLSEESSSRGCQSQAVTGCVHVKIYTGKCLYKHTVHTSINNQNLYGGEMIIIITDNQLLRYLCSVLGLLWMHPLNQTLQISEQRKKECKNVSVNWGPVFWCGEAAVVFVSELREWPGQLLTNSLCYCPVKA